MSDSTLTVEDLVAKWNADHPIGTRVRYWPTRDMKPRVTTTRSEAQVRGDGHYAAVFIDGQAGFVLLSHVEPVGPEVPPEWAEPFTDLLGRDATLHFEADGRFHVTWIVDGQAWIATGSPDTRWLTVVTPEGEFVQVHGRDQQDRIRHLVETLRIRNAIPQEVRS